MDPIENKVDKTSKEEPENRRDSQDVFRDESLNIETEMNGDKRVGSEKISATMGIGSPKNSANNVGSSKTDACNEVGSSKNGSFKDTGSSNTDADMDAGYSKPSADKSFHSNAEYIGLTGLSEIESTVKDEEGPSLTESSIVQADDDVTDDPITNCHTSFHSNYTQLLALSEIDSTIEDEEVSSSTGRPFELTQLFELENAIDVEELPLTGSYDQNVITNVPAVPFNYGPNTQTENYAPKLPYLYPEHTSANYDRKRHLNVLKWLDSVPNPVKNFSVKRKFDEVDFMNISRNKIKKNKLPVYHTNNDPSNRKRLIGLPNKTQFEKPSTITNLESVKLYADKPKDESRLSHMLVHSPTNDAAKDLSIEEEKEDDTNHSK